MVDVLDLQLKFEAAGVPRTIGEVNRINEAVESVRQENELAAARAAVLADAYGLTEREVNQVEAAVRGLAAVTEREAAEAAKEFERAMVAAAAEAEQARVQLARTIGILSGGVATGTAAFFGQALQQFQQFEQFESILENALGSPEAAQEALAVIEQFAAETPFQLDEVVQSFISLQNRGIEPTTEQLRQLGDIAASQGKDLEQVTEAILDAQTGEFERLKEFGIQASASGDQVAIAFRDANLEVERTPEAIANAIFSLGDLEGIAGSMAAQAETLTGRISNLGDEFSKASVTFGEFASQGARPVVEAAISLLQAFNRLPAPIQAVLVATTALSGVLAAAVTAITAYNLANGRLLVQEGLKAAALVRSTIATNANNAALATATAAQAVYAAATGRATAAQVAQSRAILGTAGTLGLIAGAAASVALVVDTFRSVTAEANETSEAADGVREALDAIDGSDAGTEAAQNIEELGDSLNVVQRGLDVLRGAIGNVIPGVATAAEAAANRSSIAFSELVAATDDVVLAAARAAVALEDGVSLDEGEVQRTVDAIDEATAALERQNPVADEAIERRDAQIQRLQEYRNRITSTVEGVAQLTDATGGLNDRLQELNDTLSGGEALIENAGSGAIAALERQRADGEVSASEYQARLTAIEQGGLDDRIALNREKLAELEALQGATTDPEAAEQVQREILTTTTQINELQATSDRERFQESERIRQEQEALEEQRLVEAKRRATEERDAAIAAAEEQADAITQARREESEAAESTFDDAARQQEAQFNEQQRQADQQFENQQRSQEEQFNNGQRAAEERFTSQQQAAQERFNQQQREAEEQFQQRLNEERREGNAEFDALEREVENRIALSEASTREEREAIRERIAAEEEAARIRREVEAEVLRDRNSVVDDEDTELSPLEQARADFESELQQKEAEFQEQQRLEAQAFEDNQEQQKAAFEEEQRLAEQQFQEGQRLAQQQFEDQQRTLEAEFNEGQRQAEAQFKENQRQLDRANAAQIARLLENARSTNADILARRKGGPVAPGQAYLVGEEGPELIFPSRAGYVATAGQTTRILERYSQTNRVAIASPTNVSTQVIEKKLDVLIKAVQERPRPIAPATINLGEGANEADAIQAALDYQRLQFRRRGL